MSEGERRPEGSFLLDLVQGKLLRTHLKHTAATHKSKALAGAPSNCHLPRALAPTDRSPEAGLRDTG